MKIKRILVAMLLLVLVCTLFVACNDEEQRVERKPTADPDPSNEYDIDSDPKDYSEPKYEFDGSAIVITFTNSESINNLYYDYTLADFDKSKFKSVSEKYPEDLKNIRELYDLNPYNKRIKQYLRTLTLELSVPSRENLLQYIEEFRKDKGVLWASPKFSGAGMGWFATTNKRFGKQIA